LRAPFDALTGLATRWRGSALADADRKTLALALARSRFFEYAADARTVVRRPAHWTPPALATR
jgi:hypothetical protein